MKKLLIFSIILSCLISCNTTPGTGVVESPAALDSAELAKEFTLLQDSIAYLRGTLDSTIQLVETSNNETSSNVANSEYQLHIDWMWGEHSRPAQLRCTYYLIEGTSTPTLRGLASANACVVNSIKAYRKQRTQEALSWLAAGQCHNSHARSTILHAGIQALQYAEQKFGINVPEE